MRIYALLALAALVLCAGASASLKVDPSTSQFNDQYGRVRIFHGVNVVYKTVIICAERERQRRGGEKVRDRTRTNYTRLKLVRRY